MRFRVQLAIVLTLLFLLGGRPIDATDQGSELHKFFREYAGLNDGQIAAIRSGLAVAKVLDSPSPDEVFVFGAVYVQATPEAYLKLASDIDALRKLPSYLAVEKFSSPPQLSDLNDFTVEEDDVRKLKDCKPGHCDVQLPAENMEEFQHSINWSAPDAANQVNRLARQMALEAVLKYQQGGNAALGSYRDKNHPAAVAQSFQSLIERSKILPAYLPDLDQYMIDYPKVKAENIESEFYWEKVNFGLKPTLRIVQAIVYRGSEPKQPAYAVALKQLYASHYFETALDLTVCVRGSESTSQRGFYLLTLKGSQQAGLTGVKGGIVRKVAVDKTRSSLARALDSIKQKLESQAGSTGASR